MGSNGSSGKPSLTIEDIARIAGVAKSTVSRVLNNSGSVSEKTRKKVMAVIEKYQYVPNLNAQGLGRTTTNSIGIFVSDISNQYFSEILEGAEQIISDAGYFPFICLTASAEREEFYIQEMLRRRVSGVVMASTMIQDYGLVNQLVQATKVVTVQTDIPGVKQIDCDNEHGTYEMVRHLISLGHKRIAYVNTGGQSSVLGAREAGYTRAMEEAGLPILPELQKKASKIKSPYQCTIELMGGVVKPSAIQCANDHTATSVYRALKDLTVDIPKEVSLTGFDNLPNSTLMSPGLTTVAQPIREMGANAAQLLIAAIEGVELDTAPVVYPTQIVLRGSIAPPSI